MLIIVLLVVAVFAVGYATMTQYSNTLPGESVPKRVWASVVLAASAAGGALVHAIHTWTAP